MSELIILASKADGVINELYEGELNIQTVGRSLLNSSTLAEIQAKCKGARLEYYYNTETSDSKRRELAQQLSTLKMLLGFTTIQGIIDNDLDKAGTTRTTDLDSKINQMVIAECPQNTRDVLKSKIEKTLAIMAEVNDILKQWSPVKDKGEQYSFKHHFPSPDSLKKPKGASDETEQTETKTN